jgi:hypothetical protein
MKTRERLTKAADLLQAQGWTIGTYGHPGGCHCAVGAISAVVNKDPESLTEGARSGKTKKATNRLAEYLETERNLVFRDSFGQLHKESHDKVTQWNDKLAANATEVITTLRAAAQKRSEW